MQSAHKIKILAGTWANRELVLPQGEVKIGASEEADLYIEILDAPDRIISLHVNEDGVYLPSQQLPIWISGIAVLTQNLQVLPEQKAIDIAGFVFVIAPVADDFIVIHAPERVVSRTLKRKLALTFATGLGLVSFVSICILFLFELEYEPPKRLTVADIIEEHLQQRTLKDLIVQKTEQGLYHISGHCEQSQALQSFLLRLRARGVAFQAEVTCRDTLIQNVTSALRLNGFDSVQVSAGEAPGTVLITGNIVDGARWVSVTHLLSQIQGLASWQVKNITQTSIHALIETLQKHRLLRHLSILHQGQSLILTGELVAEQEQVLNTLIQNYQEQNPAQRVIYQNIPATDNLPGVFPAEIASYGGSLDNLFIELANGTRLREGTTLPSGYKIVDIALTGVQLQKKTDFIHFPLNF